MAARFLLVILLAAVAVSCGRSGSSPMLVKRTPMHGGKVLLTLPSNWIEQRRVTNGSTEVIQLEVPDKSTENTPDSANAVLTVEPIQEGATVTNFGDARLSQGKSAEGYALLTDCIVDARWRTSLSIGHQGPTPYVIMDRFGVDQGVMVAFRLAHPVFENNGAALRQSVSNFNWVVSSLKIGETNSVDSEMRTENGVVWLRRFSDRETNWMSGTSVTWRTFKPNHPQIQE